MEMQTGKSVSKLMIILLHFMAMVFLLFIVGVPAYYDVDYATNQFSILFIPSFIFISGFWYLYTKSENCECTPKDIVTSIILFIIFLFSLWIIYSSDFFAQKTIDGRYENAKDYLNISDKDFHELSRDEQKKILKGL